MMMPWIYFVFVGVFDVGFYCYALMAAKNAARAAALNVSGGFLTPTAAAAAACPIVLNEMQSLPNVFGNKSPTGCGTPGSLGGGNLNTNSVSVTASCNDYGTALIPLAPVVCGTGGRPACGGAENCSIVITVTYVTLPLIPIPGLLASQFTFAQTAEVAFGS